jgi:hypothetical protein
VTTQETPSPGFRIEGTDIFLFTADELKEATRGFDFHRALLALKETGALLRGNTRMKVDGRIVRGYPIDKAKLAAAIARMK